MPQTIFIIIGLLIFVIGLGLWISNSAKLRSIGTGASRYDTEGPRIGRIIGGVMTGVGLLLSGIVLLTSVFVSNGVGEAKVFVNVDGTIAFVVDAPGLVTKAPWQDYVDFDLFSQEVVYAGAPGNAPVYSGGTVSGAEVTVAVGGLNGGSTQANLDISVTYSLDADAVEDIYKQYKSQERFVKQVVEKQILAAIRQVPSEYTATEFRGQFRQEATDAILELLNDKLNSHGVTIDFVSLQDIRYPENVEQALRDVEAANQKALQAEADLATAQVKAQQLIVEAQAKADANAILTQSLTPEILTQRYIDALGEGTIYVVPAGSTPFITAK